MCVFSHDCEILFFESDSMQIIKHMSAASLNVRVPKKMLISKRLKFCFCNTMERKKRSCLLTWSVSQTFLIDRVCSSENWEYWKWSLHQKSSFYGGHFLSLEYDYRVRKNWSKWKEEIISVSHEIKEFIKLRPSQINRSAVASAICVQIYCKSVYALTYIYYGLKLV